MDCRLSTYSTVHEGGYIYPPNKAVEAEWVERAIEGNVERRDCHAIGFVITLLSVRLAFAGHFRWSSNLFEFANETANGSPSGSDFLSTVTAQSQ
jgi:hypothetical protein